ncbi:MAG: alkaline phosphatase family protein [Bryobacteraceae bacterium]
MKRLAAVAPALAALLLMPGCGRNPAGSHRLIVLGVDGMDPGFLERHWDALPNLAALRRQGGFSRLGTTIPPQSPVAWSTFITGLDPGGHGIFDFVRRNPANMQPLSSLAETEESAHNISIGPYLLPLTAGRVRLLRQGAAFWQLLEDGGVPATVIRIPNNFPPLKSQAHTLAGMGTPDLAGTFGTFSFYTDDPVELSHDVAGGRIVKVRREGGRLLVPIAGPPNTLRKDRAQTSVELVVDIDPQESAARFRVGDSQFILNEHEWSGWIRARFPLIPGFKSARGMFRIYARQFHPVFQLYVSPVNIDPADPELPLSTPANYSRQLDRAVGPFYTQGIAEDTAVYRAGYFDLQEFLAQSRLVAQEQSHMLRQALADFQSGFLFVYFSTLDQNSHMLWGKHEKELLESYRTIDQDVGWVTAHAGSATILVMSDHGFTRFDRAFHVNAWLRSEGLLHLDDPAVTAAGEGFAHVDWSSTQAYAIGLNGLYVNLRGREKNGIVADGAPRAELVRRISERLLALRDPSDNAVVVDAVYEPRRVFRGRVLEYAPDLIIGYASGYRGSWQTALGATPQTILEDNRDAWIGDHCVDPRVVPGVLLANRPIRLSAPSLADLTVTILRAFGIPPNPDMQGRPTI